MIETVLEERFKGLAWTSKGDLLNSDCNYNSPNVSSFLVNVFKPKVAVK
jgi:hypothetical protein